MSLCRSCRVHLRKDFPYCTHCGRLRPGAALTEFVAPELRGLTDPALVFPLINPETTLGRDPDNDVVLDHPSVSRHHARVRRTPRGFAVADLGSRNGVEVDGEYLPPGLERRLHDSALLHVGDVALRFEQPRDTRVGSRTELAGVSGTVLAPAGGPGCGSGGGSGGGPGAAGGPGGAGEAEAATEPLSTRPRRRTGWALKRIPDERGEHVWVLRNTRTGSYLECDDRDVALWRRCDGRNSLRDLLFHDALEHGELDLPRIERALRAFDGAGLLRGLSADRGPERRSLAARVGRAVLRSRLSVPGIDDVAGRAYRRFGWWFFTPLGVALTWALALGGLVAYWSASRVQQLFDLRGGGAPAAVVGVLGFLTALVIHEAAHAFAVKSYGRRVPRAGFMIMMGLPFAFVDTSDMWFGGRSSRVVVAISGPLSTLALAGVLSLGARFGPDPVTAAVLYHVAVGLYINTLINLNPFLTLDGYQAIADAVRRPQLREEALSYLFRGLRGDLRGGRRPGVPGWGLAVYGVAAILGTAGMLAYSGSLWRHRLGPLIHPYLPPPWDLVLFGLLGTLFVLAVVLRPVLGPGWRARRASRSAAEPGRPSVPSEEVSR